MYCSAFVARGVGKLVSRNQYAFTSSTQRLQVCRNLKFSNEAGDLSTREKAVHFLQNSWKMNDVELELQTDRESFLNKLILSIHERVPFHLLSIHKLHQFLPKGQMIPNLEEINKVCISGEGGSCGVLGTFTWGLLKALGYSSYLCGSTVTRPDCIFCHLFVIVKDLVNRGDIHYVDCGIGFPTFKAISLNFDQESPIFNDSYLEYKLIKRDGKILRMHGDGDVVKRNDTPVEGFDFILGRWRRFLEFALEDFERKTFEVIDLFFDVKGGPKKYIPIAAIFPHGKAVRIAGYNLLIEQEDKKLKKTTLKSNEEILQAYKDYFPFIAEDIVQDAYSRWKKINS